MILAKKSDFTAIYSIMKASFPVDEIRPFDAEMRILDDPLCHVYVECEKGTTIGFIITWEFDRFSYIEHFAVLSAKRGCGLGERMLRELMPLLSTPICLEVEPPISEIAKHRVGFYERNGFKMNNRVWTQSALVPGQKQVELRLMTYPETVGDKIWEEMHRIISARVYNKFASLGA